MLHIAHSHSLFLYLVEYITPAALSYTAILNARNYIKIQNDPKGIFTSNDYASA